MWFGYLFTFQYELFIVSEAVGVPIARVLPKAKPG